MPQHSQALIKTEINNKISMIGKDLLDSNAYSLRRSFTVLLLFTPTKENRIKEIVNPYPRKILLNTLYINMIIVSIIIKKILIQAPPGIYRYNKIIEKYFRNIN